jgi:hypothetical protein
VISGSFVAIHKTARTYQPAYRFFQRKAFGSFEQARELTQSKNRQGSPERVPVFAFAFALWCVILNSTIAQRLKWRRGRIAGKSKADEQTFPERPAEETSRSES